MKMLQGWGGAHFFEQTDSYIRHTSSTSWKRFFDLPFEFDILILRRAITSIENFGSAINRNANEKLFLFLRQIVFVSPEAAHGHVYTAIPVLLLRESWPNSHLHQCYIPCGAACLVSVAVRLRQSGGANTPSTLNGASQVAVVSTSPGPREAGLRARRRGAARRAYRWYCAVVSMICSAASTRRCSSRPLLRTHSTSLILSPSTLATESTRARPAVSSPTQQRP